MQSKIYIKKDKDEKGIDHSINIGGLQNFWHLQEADNGYVLICEDYQKEYASLEEVNKYFISLEEFLATSSYVGQQFQRTLSLKDDDEENDDNYTKANRYSVYWALYAKDGIVLAYYLNDLFDHHKYVVIPKHYTKDGNYELVGEPVISFPDKVYNEIVKQEEGLKKEELTLMRKKG